MVLNRRLLNYLSIGIFQYWTKIKKNRRGLFPKLFSFSHFFSYFCNFPCVTRSPLFKKFLCPYILCPYIFNQVQVICSSIQFHSFVVFLVCYDDYAKIIQRSLMFKKILYPYILCPYISCVLTFFLKRGPGCGQDE